MMQQVALGVTGSGDPKFTDDSDCIADVTSSISERGPLNMSHPDSTSCALMFTERPPFDQFPLSDRFLGKIAARLEYLFSLDNLASVHMEITNFSPTNASVCPVGRLTLANDVIFTTDDDGNVTALINNTNLGFQPNFAPTGVKVTFYENVHHVNYIALICEPEILSCDTVALEYENITWNGSDVTVVTQSHGVIQLPGGWFAMLSVEKVLVCVSLMEEQIGDEEPEFSMTEYIKSILTLVGLILSIIALLVTLVTHTLFPSMRTVPGLCVINLSLALISAQSLFLVAPHLVIYPTGLQCSRRSAALSLAGHLSMDEPYGVQGLQNILW